MNPQTKRIKNAEEKIRSMQRMEADAGRLIVSGKNVMVPAPYDRSPIRIELQALGTMDDDIRLSIGGVDIFNPKAILTSYDGFRSASVTRAEALSKGAKWEYDAIVKVDVFDGWGNRYRTAPWIVSLFFADNTVTKKKGGKLGVGVSSGQRPVPAGDYYLTGPHFEDYYPNGQFRLSQFRLSQFK